MTEISDRLKEAGCIVWEDGTVWVPSYVKLLEEMKQPGLKFGIPAPAVSENLSAPLEPPTIYELDCRSVTSSRVMQKINHF